MNSQDRQRDQAVRAIEAFVAALPGVETPTPVSRILVVQPPRNEWSVTAGAFRARRGRADVARLLQAAATPRGAFRRSPEGRAHKRPSALLSALDVCWIRPRTDAAHLDACGHADRSFLGGWTTSLWQSRTGRLRTRQRRRRSRGAPRRTQRHYPRREQGHAKGNARSRPCAPIPRVAHRALGGRIVGCRRERCNRFSRQCAS